MINKLTIALLFLLPLLANTPPPLPFPSPEVEHLTGSKAAHTEEVQGRISYTGQPSMIRLVSSGRTLLNTSNIPAQCLDFSFYMSEQRSSLELSMQVRWPNGEEINRDQAVSVTLQPAQRSSRTQESYTEGNYLQDILYFVW